MVMDDFAMKNLRRAIESTGATLVGLNGIVLKSHGGADQVAFENAVNTAIVEARKGVPVQIGKLIDSEAKTCIPA